MLALLGSLYWCPIKGKQRIVHASPQKVTKQQESHGFLNYM